MSVFPLDSQRGSHTAPSSHSRPGVPGVGRHRRALEDEVHVGRPGEDRPRRVMRGERRQRPIRELAYSLPERIWER